MSVATITGKALAAIAGAAMFASATVSPVSAMPLPTMMGGAEVGAPVQQVYWDRWGHWRPGRYGYYRHHHHRHFVYRCWWTPWGHRHCAPGYAWGH